MNKLKIATLSIILVLLVSSCKEKPVDTSQEKLDKLWEKTYFFENEIGIRDDYSATAFALSVGEGGTLYLAGWASNTDGRGPRHELDGFSMSVSPSGEFERAHYIDEGSCFHIIPTSDGGMAVSGIHETESTGVITNRLLRYDAQGHPSLDLLGIEIGRRAVVELPGGDLVCLSDYALTRVSPSGEIIWNEALIEGGPVELKQQLADHPLRIVNDKILAFSQRNIHQFDFQGNRLGEIVVLDCDDCSINSMLPTDDGGLMVIGSVKGPDVNITNYQGNDDVVLVKFDAAGQMEWQRLLGGTELDQGYSVQATDGGYLLLVGSYSTNGDMADWVENTGLELRTLVVKVTAQGELEWMEQVPASAYTMRPTPDGAYVVAGSEEAFVSGMDRLRVWVLKFRDDN
jgi:hypothetical protein